MQKDYKAFADSVSSSSLALAEEIPGVIDGLHALAEGLHTETTQLDEKTQRLISLGVAVSMHCVPCISVHARALVQLKASRREVADAVGICIKMGGAPTLTYAADALRAYDLFSAAGV